MRMVRKPLTCMGQAPLERPTPVPDPSPFTKTTLLTLEREISAYLDFQNATEFRMLFNIDADTTMNAKKYGTWFYLIKSHSILGLGGLSLCLYKDFHGNEEIVPTLNYFWNS